MAPSARQQVKAAIIRVIADAEAQGQNGVSAAQRAFPGTPDTVFWECWADWDTEQTNAWWKSVEETIDGEIIQRALQKASA